MIETMKILLNAINAKYIHSNLAVYSLRAYAKEYREHIRLLEYTINNRVEEILEGIYKERAEDVYKRQFLHFGVILIMKYTMI